MLLSFRVHPVSLSSLFQILTSAIVWDHCVIIVGFLLQRIVW
jgi:hypothetical protein